MLNGLNIPRPGEHVYMHGQKLNGLYKVVEAEYVHETEEFRFNITPVFSANDSREMPVNYIYRTALAHGGEWFYPRTPDADFNHQVSIVLPTAGRPVFIKLPDIEGMEKVISGTVQWSRIDPKKNYMFAILYRHIYANEDFFQVYWDQQREVWTLHIPQGDDGDPIAYDVEVTFG